MPGTGTVYLTQARYDVRTTLAIAIGRAVPRQRTHALIGEGGAGVPDNLDALVLTSPQDGDEHVFYLALTSGPITVRHRPITPVPTGNEFNLGDLGTRFVMDNPRSMFRCRFNASSGQWDVIEVQDCTVQRAIALDWTFGVRGKPGVNGDILATGEAVRMIADPNFEVVGAGPATSAMTAVSPTGGVICTTTLAGIGDQVGIQPHTDLNESGWNSTQWSTGAELIWEGWLQTGLNVVDVIIGFGLKLTFDPDPAIDADEIFFRYQDTVLGGRWAVEINQASGATQIDTGIAVNAGQVYHFKLVCLADLSVEIWVDGALIDTAPPIDTTNLLPMFAIENEAASAETSVLIRQKISRI